MQHVFLDESGDLGFTGGSTHFVIALLSPQSGSALSKVIKNFNAHLMGEGWNKSVEIKATNLFNCPRNRDIPATFAYKKNPEVPIQVILQRIAALQVEIDYAVVRLSTVYDYLKKLPDAILYNYFSLQVLTQRLSLYPAVTLWVDRRNREYHHQLHFDGYIETQIQLKRAETKKENMALTIKHIGPETLDATPLAGKAQIQFSLRGLEAVDFVCWAIKRGFENEDDRWRPLVAKKIRFKNHLYF
jgi:hypothetical protein